MNLLLISLACSFASHFLLAHRFSCVDLNIEIEYSLMKGAVTCPMESPIEIKALLPSNYPAVTATEIYAENVFLLEDDSKMIREWLKMTKVARIFEEEKIEAVNEAVKNDRLRLAKMMLAKGKDSLEIMEYTGFTKTELAEIQTLAMG